MENRRDFFKAAGLFFAGMVTNKLNAMAPKKKEDKDELMVSEKITIHHQGVDYHPVVVKRTTTVVEETKYQGPDSGSLERLRITSNGNVGIGNAYYEPRMITVHQNKEPQLRKLK